MSNKLAVSSSIFITFVFFGVVGTWEPRDAAAQTTVQYRHATDLFPNPERGFYRHKETHSDSYVFLNEETLRSYRENDAISLILRLFYLDDFVTSDIEPWYLDNIQTDFNTLRSAGLKAIVRFAYNKIKNADAERDQVVAHIHQLQNVLRDNGDVIATVQAGFIGPYGEWHSSTNFPTNNILYRQEVLGELLDAVPGNLMVAVRTPAIKQAMYNNTTFSSPNVYAYNGTQIARTGHHNDCFLANETDTGTYRDFDPRAMFIDLEPDKEYLEAETVYLAMGGETCLDKDQQGNPILTGRSLCDTAILELERFHWSYLNQGFHPDVIAAWMMQTQGQGPCFEEINRKLGYRFVLDHGMYTDQVVAPGNTFTIDIVLHNDGWAAPYNPRPVELVLRRSDTAMVYDVALPEDPRLWLAGGNETLNYTICTPASMPAGDYDLLLNLPDPNPSLNGNPAYSMRFANTNVWEGATGYNSLWATIEVSSSPAPNPCSGGLMLTPRLCAPFSRPEPVSWWPADGHAHNIANGNNGTLNGGASFTSLAGNRIGEAFDLNGTNAYVEVGGETALSFGGTSPFTIDAWVNPTAAGGVIISKYNLRSRGEYILKVDANRQIFFYREVPPSYGALLSNKKIPLGTFSHIAVTYDGTTRRIFIDGELDASDSTSNGALNTDRITPVLIGARFNQGARDQFFNGLINDVRIFSRALEFTEVRALYNGTFKPSATSDRCTPPRAHWRFEEGAGTLAIDASDNGNTGTISGAKHVDDTPVIPGFTNDYALEFNQEGDYVEIDAGPSTNLNLFDTGITLEAFIKPYYLPIRMDDAGQRIKYMIWADDDIYSLLLRSDLTNPGVETYLVGAINCGTNVSGTAAVSLQALFSIDMTTDSELTRAFTHVAMTFGSGVMTLFINGEQVSQSSTGPCGNNLGPVSAFRSIARIGSDETATCCGSDFDRDFRGVIDEVRITAFALDPSEFFKGE